MAARASAAEVLVGLVDGVLAGSVTSVTAGGPLADRAAHEREASFRMLAVSPGARGKGVGEALVRACLDRARTAGCHGVAISTQPSMTTAHRLYERLGFHRSPDRDWSPVPDLVLWCYRHDLGVCDRCGQPGTHPACRAARELEPPRFCPACGHRLVVQVTPTGWTARCTGHTPPRDYRCAT